MTISYEELLAYWRKELTADREAEVEERIFADDETARRLDVIARLGEGLHAVVAAGKMQAGLTVETVEALAARGLALRTYEIAAGETVLCGIDEEDFVVVRLEADFGDASRVDVSMEGTLEGSGPARESYDDVLVDREKGQVVLVYPGDRIRALPKARIRYTITAGDRTLGEYHMVHTPSG